jgi:hypothetical protein
VTKRTIVSVVIHHPARPVRLLKGAGKRFRPLLLRAY